MNDDEPAPKAPQSWYARANPLKMFAQRAIAAFGPLAYTTASLAAACAPVPLMGQSSSTMP